MLEEVIKPWCQITEEVKGSWRMIQTFQTSFSIELSTFCQRFSKAATLLVWMKGWGFWNIYLETFSEITEMDILGETRIVQTELTRKEIVVLLRCCFTWTKVHKDCNLFCHSDFKWNQFFRIQRRRNHILWHYCQRWQRDFEGRAINRNGLTSRSYSLSRSPWISQRNEICHTYRRHVQKCIIFSSQFWLFFLFHWLNQAQFL